MECTRTHGGQPPYHGADHRGRPIYRLPDYLLLLARGFRGKSTPPEAALWACLRKRRLLGAKFRRQHSVGRYIADFYCDEARLVIELDGAWHHDGAQQERDALRDEALGHGGFRVLRITNRAVTDDLVGVLRRIANAVREEKEPSPPTPLPEGEGRQ